MDLKFFRWFVICGDFAFILWIFFNAIDEGFKGTVYQKISYVSLLILLVLNITLIYRKSGGKN